MDFLTIHFTKLWHIYMDLCVFYIFSGVVKGSSPSNAEPIFQYLSPIFSDFPTLVGVYRNYQQIVELVFEFFSECALNLFFLPHNSKKNIYESCIQTIQTYSKCNVGRLSLHSNAQEETFNDIYLLLKLLKDLLPSDYYDLYNLGSLVIFFDLYNF